jgi:hypothetical protein
MSDDTIRAIEEFLRSRGGVLDENLCLGCAKVVDGVSYLRVEMINDRGIDTDTVISVCSWACLRDLAEEVAGGA